MRVVWMYRVIVFVSLILVAVGCFGMVNMFNDASNCSSYECNVDDASNSLSTTIYYVYTDSNYNDSPLAIRLDRAEADESSTL